MSKDTRKTCVKQLRAVAREFDVAQIRDDCGRSKVQEWFQTVVRAAGSKKKPDLKAKAEKGEKSISVCAESFDNSSFM